MKKQILFLIILTLLLGGCNAMTGGQQTGVVDCQTALNPAAGDPVASVMPRQSELPEDFRAVACDRLVEDEGFSAMNVARLYGVTQGWPGHLAVFNNPTQKVFVFIVSPIYIEDRQTFTDLLRTVNQYAAFRMVNAGIKLDSMPQAEAFGQNNKLGEQSAAFGFPGRDNEINLPVSQPVMHDLILVRRGAVIYGIESVYGTQRQPSLTREKMLDLAAAMDGRLKAVLADNADLNKVAIAPTPDWSTTTNAAADRLAALPVASPDLPGDFAKSEEPSSDLITAALGSWMGRAVNSAQYTRSSAPGEGVRTAIIYPLDAQEQEMFRRLLKSPEQVTAYLIKPLASSKVITPSDDLSKYYTIVPDAAVLKGTGDAANGFTLTLGELQDTALVLVGRALVVVSVSHAEGTPAPVSAAKYAAWLAGQVKQVPDS